MLREVSPSPGDKYFIVPLTCGVKNRPVQETSGTAGGAAGATPLKGDRVSVWGD